ncbi:MAG: glycerol-3-phosphate 1-O-acyltransferase PlsY [Burkholderiaceae bacterium]|jgi:glycerol-3-phosphate acyltransferase PlsY|nr:glycerol-3-phosphate 1-O-acyltransferase PlsY [Burkholderiaceae bacterium]MBU6292904.1 glycerol-3-phosphate 1-O-acyltransferase PlsY [Burkholderiales bacterium]NCV84481.1 glycerol-3-phosphate 1-O-acyltransferase PlsY [Oxalobacteraceae bacterium]NDG06567.1 glycerol-3-phosphate 1-O-acyltransferase PlsY [Oxalobacteraceae bacterium]
MLTLLFFAVAAYLLGSVSFAIVVSKLFRLADPRTFGSGNPGATNVLRTGNKVAAALTLLGDCLKGVVPVALAVYFEEQLGLGDAGVALISVAVFAGHLWPVYFRFKGGKGVATALGVLLGLNPVLGLATLVTWIVIAYAFRYSSLAALVSALFAPFYYTLLFGLNTIGFAVLVMSVLLIWRHKTNIGNLISGRESKIGKSKT